MRGAPDGPGARLNLVTRLYWYIDRDMPSVLLAFIRGEKWHLSGLQVAFIRALLRACSLSDQLNACRSNQQLHREQSSGWIQTPCSSSLARSASPQTALKAGVDVLPHSLFLFLHSVLPGSSSVSRCSHSSEKHFIPTHFGCSRPRSLPSSLRIPASGKRAEALLLSALFLAIYGGWSHTTGWRRSVRA